MTTAALIIASFVGAAIAVTAWLTAIRLHRWWPTEQEIPDPINRLAALERFKLVLLAALAVIIIGLSLVVNDISNKLLDVGNVRKNQNCIIALLRTEHGLTVAGGVVEPAPITDVQLKARGCPVAPPFSP